MTLLIALSCLLAVSAASDSDACYKDVSLDCSQTSSSLTFQNCNAVYGKYGSNGNVATEMQAYANLHLERSYQFLLSAAYFNNYQTSRPGFGKLFKKLSDEAWEKSIELIKHVTLRGGVMDFSRRSSQDSSDRHYTVELHELEALAKALDTQKELAERAFHIHKEATKANEKIYDPEITQFLEEEFMEYHSNSIRDLAGHSINLKEFITTNNGQDLSLALYLFDEYLKKIV
ncbi:ferritin, lower subunit [Hyposmocoma kahamanoa]|uniref:ferritin, lower subunit n=1 Tax=Hyposmocoma kahamanoa TaxID=1477025 RepID=UPI000E6D851F|nr:ferritin, lower subunit [Hyposmocoma kahamanoa]